MALVICPADLRPDPIDAYNEMDVRGAYHLLHTVCLSRRNETKEFQNVRTRFSADPEF
jgi:hypothetical protein